VVFIEGDIADPVQAVFDGPVGAAELQDAGRLGFLSRKTGDAVDGLAAVFIAGQLGGAAFYTKDLAEIGEIQIMVELGAGPDVTDFQSSVGLINGGVLRGEKRSDPALRCPFAGLLGCL
jgi:hypothetical protein